MYQENLLPLLDPAKVNHKIKTLSRDKNPGACDFDVPDATSFQNTCRLLPHNCLLQHSSLELMVGLVKDWPPEQR